ncbi:MAG TPA: NHL repeat-containing protein [Solirubrobacteraceae bacterium]
MPRGLLAAAIAAVAAALTAADARACTGAECYVQAATLGESPATGTGVLRFPQAIAYTPGASNILVADQLSAVVQRFDRSGAWLGELGGYADAGQVGRIGVVGGLATDRAGHVYVLDSENDRVQVFEAATGRWLAAWGSTGQGPGQFRLGDNTGAGGLAIAQPTAADTPVAYVADQYNHRIQVFRLDQDATGDAGHPVLPAGARTGDVVSVPTPTLRWGTFGDCSAGTCADPTYNSRFNYPQGIAVDARSGHVLVADDDNHRVVEFLPDGTYVRQIGSYGVGAGQFRFPYDVGIDAREPRQLYVADNNNHRVQAFDFATLAFQRTWGQFGTEVGDFGFTRALAAVADDPVGGVAVADTANNRVQTFAPDGAPTAAWGIAGRGPGYVTRPEGVAIDAAGNVHVADTVDHRVERLGPDGAYLGQTGYISANSGYAAPNTGNGQFNTPGGIAVDRAAGRVWVADTANSRVQALGLDGTWQATATGFNAPRQLAVAPDGAVYVADTGNGRIQRRDPAGGAWTTFAAGLSSPSGVAATSDAVYVADTADNRIQRIAGTTTTTLPAPPGGLSAPTGVAAAAGAVYVADTGANRVLRFNEGPGTWDVIGDDGTGPGQFIAPHGLALDAGASTLIVADTGNDRLQRITLSGTPRAALARLDVATAGTGTGSVLSVPAGIWCPTDCRQGFSPGAVVRLTARAASGSTFAGWSGACAGTGPCDVSMGAERSVAAAFAATGPPAAPSPAGPGPTSQPAPSSAANARDRTAPRLRGVSLRPRRLRAARRGATIAALASGATLRYALSERGALSIAVERAGARGRFKALPGTLRRATTAGAHRLSFRARLRGRPLRAGRYRLVLRATDAAGNRSAAKRLAFTVVASR